MELADFFRAAPHARPVNPKRVQFTAICKDDVLPGGTPNPSKRPVAATIVGCLVYISPPEIEEARADARAALRARHVDKKTRLPLPYDDGDFNLENLYQQLWRTLRQYDDKTRAAGELLFPDAESLHALVAIHEADRVMGLYNAYIKAEHPEVVDDETFRDPQAPSG